MTDAVEDDRMERLIESSAIAEAAGFSGIYLDPGSGRTTIAVTGQFDMGAVPPELVKSVGFVTAKFTAAELNAAMGTVTAALNRDLGAKVSAEGAFPYIAAVDTIDNRIDVEISAGNTSDLAVATRALDGQINAGLVNIRLGSSPIRQVHKACTSRTYDCNPMRGGIELTPAGLPPGSGGGCTSGFIVRNPLGVKEVMTAGHCAAWANRDHNGLFVGGSAGGAYYNQGSIDAMTYTIDGTAQQFPSNTLYRNSNVSTAVTTKVSNTAGLVLGSWLCSEGAFGGTRCGGLDSLNASWLGVPGFGRFTANTCGGDSGATIVRDSTVRAYGVLKGGPPGCASPTWFTWVPNAEFALGRTLLLSPYTESLGVGQRLESNQLLLSTNGLYNLRMQADGNLVMSWTSSGAVIWNSGTYQGGAKRVVMQSDGNLVIYNVSSGQPVWWTGSFAQMYHNGRLVLQNDHNLVVYANSGAPIWASNT